jgi:hypothetical protein
MAALKQENEALQRELEEMQVKAIHQAEGEATRPSVPAVSGMQETLENLTAIGRTRNVALAIGAALLVAGLACGMWLMDYMQRRRHGGFRI